MTATEFIAPAVAFASKFGWIFGPDPTSGHYILRNPVTGKRLLISHLAVQTASKPEHLVAEVAYNIGKHQPDPKPLPAMVPTP